MLAELGEGIDDDRETDGEQEHDQQCGRQLVPEEGVFHKEL